MALKWKVKDGKAYLWDSFANRWSYRWPVNFPVKEGEYQNEIPVPAEVKNTLKDPYATGHLLDLPIKGVAAAGEAVAEKVGGYGKKVAESIAKPFEKAVKAQFPERGANEIYAPTMAETATQKMLLEPAEMLKSVVAKNIPVQQPSPEAVFPTQPAPPVAQQPVAAVPAQQPMPTTPARPAVPEGMDMETYNRITSQGIDPYAFQESLQRERIASLERARERKDIFSRNPWMGGGHLSTKSQEEIERFKKLSLDEQLKIAGPKTPVKPADQPVQATQPTKQYHGMIEGIPATQWFAEHQTPKVAETPAPEQKPIGSEYAQEYARRYQQAMAGRGGYTSSSTGGSSGLL
jgi:hypothetical protein